MNVALLSQPQRELRAYLQRVAGDGGIVETPGEASTFVRRLRSAGVLGSTVIAGVAGGVKAGTLYSIIGPDLDVTRGTVKNRVNRAGVLSEVASGVPATDFAGGVLRGTTVEPSAVNLALRSEEFDNGFWSIQRGTITPNITVAPSGTLTADLFVEDTQTGEHRFFSGSVAYSPSASNTISVFAKAKERDEFQLAAWNSSTGQTDLISTFNLSTKTATNGGVIDELLNGWFRCILSFTQSVSTGYLVRLSNGSSISYTGDGVSGMYFWGAQVETGSVATSYIKTEGSAQTRNADVITKTGLGSVLPQTEGWVYADYNALLRAGMQSTVFCIDDNNGTSINNRHELAINSIGNLRYQVVSNGMLQVDITPSGNTTNQDSRVLLTFANQSFKLFRNGLLVGSNTVGTLPLGINSRIFIGRRATEDTLAIIQTHSYAIGSGAITDASAIQLTTL
jgi:hypothetical protein